MIDIVDINWLSKEAREAEVQLTDGTFSILCFSSPFQDSYNPKVPLPLNVFESDEVYRLDKVQSCSVERGRGRFDYTLSGKVIDVEKNQIEIGKFILELDVPLPRDIREGEFLSFNCDRIDIY